MTVVSIANWSWAKLDNCGYPKPVEFGLVDFYSPNQFFAPSDYTICDGVLQQNECDTIAGGGGGQLALRRKWRLGKGLFCD